MFVHLSLKLNARHFSKYNLERQSKYALFFFLFYANNYNMKINNEIFIFFFLQANDIITNLLDVNASADKHLENEVIEHFYHDLDFTRLACKAIG